MTPEEELEQLAGQTNQPPAKQTPPPPPPKVEEKPSPAPSRTGQPSYHPEFWGDSDIASPSPVAKVQAPAEPGTPAAPGTRVSKQAIDMGARTAVATINLTQTTLMRPLINWKWRKEGRKRFGDDFDKGLDDIMDERTPTDEKERTRKLRVQRFLDQRDKKLIDVPFTSTEEKDLEYAFKTYFDMKQVTMSPEVLLYCSLGSILGKRAIDVFIWD